MNPFKLLLHVKLLNDVYTIIKTTRNNEYALATKEGLLFGEVFRIDDNEY